MKHEQLKKLVTSALLVAVIIALSGFYIPVGVSKCFPIQHMVNILSAILLGPGWGCRNCIRRFSHPEPDGNRLFDGIPRQHGRCSVLRVDD